MPVDTIEWKDRTLTIIDQTLLPGEFRRIALESLEQVHEAIQNLRVRGAPAIGVCAAFGVLVGLHEKRPATGAEARAAAEESASYLATSRPTAVNLFWALDRMKARAASIGPGTDADSVFEQLEDEAVRMLEEDRRLCRLIGESGAALIQEDAGVLTHCNAGGLATVSYGTALAVMFHAHEEGRNFHVFAGETRPLLQGARLTAWELMQAGVDVTLICDNMAAQVMREGKIQLVLVGADRIAANGDTANKIGTYSLAVLAKAHEIPFYIAAPASTFDLSIPNGEHIPIEQRPPEEITAGFGKPTAPEGVKAYNPAFDVTPAHLITGIVTEHGILRPPYAESIQSQIAESTAAEKQ